MRRTFMRTGRRTCEKSWGSQKSYAIAVRHRSENYLYISLKVVAIYDANKRQNSLRSSVFKPFDLG